MDLGAMAIKGCSSIIATSTSDSLVSYPGHWLVGWGFMAYHPLWGESYLSTEKHSVYSTAPADWASK